MDINDLSPEIKEKAAACKSPEELIELAKEVGYELSDDELSAISGGGNWESPFVWDCDDYTDPCPSDCHAWYR